MLRDTPSPPRPPCMGTVGRMSLEGRRHHRAPSELPQSHKQRGPADFTFSLLSFPQWEERAYFPTSVGHLSAQP